MLGLEFFEFRDYEIERLIPACTLKHAVSLDKGMQESIGMVNVQVSRHTFWTQPTLVYWKIVARLKSYNVIVLDQQIHTALHGAIKDSVLERRDRLRDRHAGQRAAFCRSGKVIRNDCNICHTILADSADPSTALGTQLLQHPVDLGSLANRKCETCHKANEPFKHPVTLGDISTRQPEAVDEQTRQ